jgi:hypothetical protein
VGRVTLIVPADLVRRLPELSLPGDIMERAFHAAARAAAAAAPGAGGAGLSRDSAECAHPSATAAYRPAPLLREYVVARDLTCRFPGCGQPAWRGDLDHTWPWDQGGLTCSCNLGPLCRHHHILKQHPDWQLIQAEPGVFEWITPTGRVYTATPASHVG